MVVRLHKKCTYSGLIFSVAFVACACAGCLSKSCSLQVQRLQVALWQLPFCTFRGLNREGPNINKWTVDCGILPFAVAQLVFHTSLPSGRLEHCLPLRTVTIHILVHSQANSFNLQFTPRLSSLYRSTNLTGRTNRVEVSSPRPVTWSWSSLLDNTSSMYICPFHFRLLEPF